MRVLIGCERSAVIRDAFRAIGCDAWSCDLEPCEADARWHIQGDVLQIADPARFNLFIVHPECRYLSVSGMHWNGRKPGRAQKTADALEFARQCFALCERFEGAALENPVSILSTRFRPADQIIQPYEFGEDASKSTCLWLWNLAPLTPTLRVIGRMVEHNGKRVERWSNQTDSGQNRLGPSETRSMDRARTYAGIARAMAEQWSKPQMIQKRLFAA